MWHNGWVEQSVHLGDEEKLFQIHEACMTLKRFAVIPRSDASKTGWYVDKCLILKLIGLMFLSFKTVFQVLHTWPNVGIHSMDIFWIPTFLCLISIEKKCVLVALSSLNLLYLYILHLLFTWCLRCVAMLLWQWLDSHPFIIGTLKIPTWLYRTLISWLNLP